MPKNLYLRDGTWQARFKVRGVEYRRSPHTTVRGEAERRLAALRKQIEGEVRFGLAGPMTFAAAMDSWERNATAALSPKTTKRYLTSLKQVWHLLAAMPVHTIDSATIRDLVKARRVMGASTATIKRDLTAISAILKHAADEEWMEDINPTLSYRAKKSMVERRVPITLPTDHEVAMVMAMCTSRFSDAIEFAIETGMREEEILGLTHKQIAGGFITITGKRAKRRVIVLSRKAERIIARQVQDIKSPWVFRHSENDRWSSPSARFGDIRRRTAKAAQNAAQEFVGFRFHDLRHYYAVNFLRKRKGTLYELQMILGHDSVTTTEIYLEHLSPADRLFAIHRVTQKVARG